MMSSVIIHSGLVLALFVSCRSALAAAGGLTPV